MAVRLAKDKPKWLRQIADENLKEANKAFQGRCEFVGAYLEFQDRIEEINDKFGTDFALEDIFGITEEEEQKALDMLEGDDEDDDDDDEKD